MPVVTRNPTYSSGQWFFITNAYTSDNNYALCSKIDDYARYYQYGFQNVLPVDAIIDKVEIGIEFYCGVGEGVRLRVSADWAGSWSVWSMLFRLATENTVWVDVTAYKTWLRSDLLDGALMVDIKYDEGEGHGCPEKAAWTAYLDWIPVRVTYHLPLKKVVGDGLFWRKA